MSSRRSAAQDPNTADGPVTWLRWQPAAFDLAAPSDAEPQDEPPPAPVEPEPDPAVVREAARQAGFDEGYQQGKEQGHTEGHAQGLATGLQEGRANGHAEGYSAGLAEGQTLAREHAEQLQRLGQSLACSLRNLEQDIGQGLISLALEIARHVVGDTLAQHPETIVANVRQVMQADPDAQAPLRVWVHPDDLALVNTYLADDIAHSDWCLLSDARLSRGSCRAETAFGAIDATLETRWRRVAASLGRQSTWQQPEP